MKAFMDDNFLLENETAVRLYHDYAKEMPIYDYHCHLPAQEIADNISYDNMTELWLGGDHYKWRGMRSNGVDEAYITGDRPDKEKFLAYAEMVPYTIGNPLYHWTHLELQRYFDIETPLSLKTADEIWTDCNQKLQSDDFKVKALIERSNVKVICTTDDPVDDLNHHKIIKEDRNFKTKVLPTFRPDKGINLDRETFKPWLNQLEQSLGRQLNDFDSLTDGLLKRVSYFHGLGCRVADHGLDRVQYLSPDVEVASNVFNKALNDAPISNEEIAVYKGTLFNLLGKAYAEKGWVLQMHIGAMRNNSTRNYKNLGPDTGFDSVGDELFAEQLSKMLDDLDKTDELPKTILYPLNPRDNYVIGTMIGNFQGGGIPGKIQFGSGWWFCDQKEGMVRQMKDLASLGLLSRFVGMLTDSRSFLSYTRHEYFRRILCNLIGQWVENGEYPSDMEFLGQMVQDISYNNAVNYFDIDVD